MNHDSDAKIQDTHLPELVLERQLKREAIPDVGPRS